MNKEKEEFLHAVLGSDSDFRYGYDDVKEIFVSPDDFEGARGKFRLTGDVKAFITKDNELVFPDEDNTKFELYDVEDNTYNVRSTLPLGVTDEQGLVDYLKETYTDEDSVHKVHQRNMAYDYFNSGAVSPTDFYYKYPNYTEASPLSESKNWHVYNVQKMSSNIWMTKLIERLNETIRIQTAMWHD